VLPETYRQGLWIQAPTIAGRADFDFIRIDSQPAIFLAALFVIEAG